MQVCHVLVLNCYPDLPPPPLPKSCTRPCSVSSDQLGALECRLAYKDGVGKSNFVLTKSNRDVFQFKCAWTRSIVKISTFPVPLLIPIAFCSLKLTAPEHNM